MRPLLFNHFIKNIDNKVKITLMKFYLFVYVVRRVTKIEMTSSQWCMVKGREAVEQKLKHEKFILGIRKNFFTIRLSNHWTMLPEIMLSLHPWRSLKTVLHVHKQPVLTTPVLSWGQFPEVPSNLNNSVILRVY